MAADTLILAPASAELAARLASLAADAGYDASGHGPLVLITGSTKGLDDLAVGCASSLSAVEAASTRVLRVDFDPTVTTTTVLDILPAAMAAETLATVAARTAHGAMLDALYAGEGVQAAYQPVVEVRTRRIVGFEALLRLDHDGRSVPPADVFRAAADIGRLADADAAARHAAIRNAAGWIGPRTLFVNLVPEAIGRPSDLDATDAAVAASRLGRDQVVFEISVPDDPDDRHVLRVLDHLRQRGYGIGLDDVTDHPAALSMVQYVRPDVIKIGGALTGDLPGIQARSAVATIVGAAHAVRARVGAKGIETASQLDAVRFVGVDDAQGWQVGQPMRPPGSSALAS